MDTDQCNHPSNIDVCPNFCEHSVTEAQTEAQTACKADMHPAERTFNCLGVSANTQQTQSSVAWRQKVCSTAVPCVQHGEVPIHAVFHLWPILARHTVMHVQVSKELADSAVHCMHSLEKHASRRVDRSILAE